MTSIVRIVTGTDTGVGKTVVTAALVAHARARGESAYVVKPAQTGIADGEPTDLTVVRRLVGGVPGHEGVTLPEPLAPETAARRAGVPLPSLADQVAGIANAAAWHGVTVVEGAGGLRVRLGDGWDLLDLADALGDAGDWPVEFVVVARAGLGTLNHSVLTVDAIRDRGHRVAGVVIGSMPAEPDIAAAENLRDLPALTGVPLLGTVPAGAGALVAADFRAAAPGWFDLP